MIPKIICSLDTDRCKIFESSKQVITAGDLKGKIIWHNVPYIQYEQIRLNGNFRQYLETDTIVKNVLRMGIQKTPYQKSYELAVLTQSYTVDFIAAIRQLHWLQISLAYDKSDKHQTIYDSLQCRSFAHQDTKSQRRKHCKYVLLRERT